MIVIGRAIKGGASEEVTSASGEQPCKKGKRVPGKKSKRGRRETRQVWWSRSSRDSVATAESAGQK